MVIDGDVEAGVRLVPADVQAVVLPIHVTPGQRGCFGLSQPRQAKELHEVTRILCVGAVHLTTNVSDDALELGDGRHLPLDSLGLLPALAQELGGRLWDNAILHRNVEKLLEEPGVAVVGHVPQARFLVGQPLVEHGRADQAHLVVPSVGPPGQKVPDDGAVGDVGVVGHAAGDLQEAPDQLAEGGLLHLGIHLLQVAQPLLEPAFGNLAVSGLEAAFPADAAHLLAGVVASAASMTIQAGNVGHLEVGGLFGDDRSKQSDHERGCRRTKEGVAAPRSSLWHPPCPCF